MKHIFAARGLAVSSVFLSVLMLPTTAVVNAQNGRGSGRVLTIDHYVPHISTVPANEGEEVELFVRERVRPGHRRRPVVLMVHGASTPASAVFDLRFEDYSWMAYLARAGFDIFAMDHQGYGLSARPMMDDPCNTTRAQQTAILIPNPLPAPCDPSYPFTLSNIQSDWDEIDTVVDYIRRLRGVERVSLVGWSRGGVRLGGYTARHPEKVDKLFLYAPRYRRTDPSDPPAELPQPGVPMTVQRAHLFPGWDGELECENQFTPAIRDVLTSTLLHFDPLGSTWGDAGVFRFPNQGTLFGWNATVARQIEVPTLIIAGDLDRMTGVPDGRNLYDDLPIDNKVFVHVECASHFLVYENQHSILLRASEEWLRNGTFVGHRDGSFFVDTDGGIYRE